MVIAPPPTPDPVATSTPTSSSPAVSPTDAPSAGSEPIGAPIATGYSYTCALTSGGGVNCWGSNNGARGKGDTSTDSLTPVDVAGLTSGVTTIAAGTGHACVLTSGGGVKCWGNNYLGQLGNGSSWSTAGIENATTPVDVLGLAGEAIAIAVGDATTCVLMRSGGVRCWGWNGWGQLGDGSTIDSATPVDILGLAGEAIAIAVGDAHTCELTSAGWVTCWGSNGWGQLGDGTTRNSLIPVDVVFASQRLPATDTAGPVRDQGPANQLLLPLLTGLAAGIAVLVRRRRAAAALDSEPVRTATIAKVTP